MPSRSTAAPDLATTLAWIETHLDDALTLDRIAAHAGLSSFYFSRLFTARTGRSVMAHVRNLRLVRAARRLANDPSIGLTDLAFDSGFESQEAFIRAFQRLFGTTPGRMKFAYGTTMPDLARKRQATVTAKVERLPGLVERDAFTLLGLQHRFEDDTQLAIPGLWERFAERTAAFGRPHGAYGVIFDADPVNGAFEYMAGMPPMDGLDDVTDLRSLHIAANTYAVFRMTLDAGPVHPQILAANEAVWAELLPASGLEAIEAADFEYYDARFRPGERGSVVDYHVPVSA
jgi:AraC family transcriptional regulator